jgi:hypothetical protein
MLLVGFVSCTVGHRCTLVCADLGAAWQLLMVILFVTVPAEPACGALSIFSQ